MAKKRQAAKEVAEWRDSKTVRITHAFLDDSDVAHFQNAESLTLWNVTFPEDFLAQLNNLWWLDIRGGTQSSLSYLSGIYGLKYLALNQIRGLNQINEISELKKLQLLSLYGLSKVETLPSFKPLDALRRLQIGQMKNLKSLGPLFDAPGLCELELIKGGPDR